MKRLLLLSALAGVFLFVMGAPVFAGTTEITGTLTTAEPLLPNGSLQDDDNTCDDSLDTTGDFYYLLKQFQVTESGDYVYYDLGYNESTGIDIWVTFYTGSPDTFDPTNPGGNGCLGNFDDDGTVNLTAGVTYMMLITSYDGDPPIGDFIFTLTGLGDVIDLPSLALRNPMLDDGRINGQQAAPIILYCDGTTLKGYSVSGAALFSVADGGTASGAWGSVGTAPDGRMLVSGWFEDGKAYYFAFEGCPHGKYDAFSGEPPQLFDSGSY